MLRDGLLVLPHDHSIQVTEIVKQDPLENALHQASMLDLALQRLSPQDLKNKDIQDFIAKLLSFSTVDSSVNQDVFDSYLETSDGSEIKKLKLVIYRFDTYIRSIEILLPIFADLGKQQTENKTLSGPEIDAYRMIYPNNKKTVLHSQPLHYTNEVLNLKKLIKWRLTQHVQRLNEIPQNTKIQTHTNEFDRFLILSDDGVSIKSSLRKDLFVLRRLVTGTNKDNLLDNISKIQNLHTREALLESLERIETFFHDKGLTPFKDGLIESLSKTQNRLESNLKGAEGVDIIIIQISKMVENLTNDKYRYDWPLLYFDTISIPSEGTTFNELVNLTYSQINTI